MLKSQQIWRQVKFILEELYIRYEEGDGSIQTGSGSQQYGARACDFLRLYFWPVPARDKHSPLQDDKKHVCTAKWHECRSHTNINSFRLISHPKSDANPHPPHMPDTLEMQTVPNSHPTLNLRKPTDVFSPCGISDMWTG